MAEVSRSIPARLNLVLLLSGSLTAGLLLYGAAHASHPAIFVACAVAFSLVGNTLFSLMHEAVHGILHPTIAVNEMAGRLASAWFPTGLSVQRALHLTHHRYNRSRFEQFDLLHDDDVKWLKYAQWYAILTGIYWLFAVLGAVAYAVLPQRLRAAVLVRQSPTAAEQTGAAVHLAALDEIGPVRGRLEVLGSVAFQGTLFFALDLTWWSWLACYGAFAISWSSLQYADHAFSVLDRREGAWNLKVNPVIRVIFLNYHAHLAHHRSPGVPWIHLPKLVAADDAGPSFRRIWLSMWRGPVLARRFEPGRIPVRGAGTQSVFNEPFLALPRGFDAFAGAALVTLFILVFLICYGGASFLSGYVPWRIRVDLPVEQLIPFHPATAAVYISTNLLLMMAPFVLRTTRMMVPLFCVMVIETVIAALFFLAIPVDSGYPARHVEGAASIVFQLADTLNMERNEVPSLHVALAFTAVTAYAQRLRSWPAKLGLFAWPAAIAISALLMHEHHLVDLVAGILLAVICWRIVGPLARRKEVMAAFDVELLCLREFCRFGRRHRRYWGIALALYRASLPRFMARRVLRTGFCMLQQVDDLLDGDRPSEREPLDVVAEVADAIRRDEFGESDLMRLAQAFTMDLRAAGGETALDDALDLIRVMMTDRRRVLEERLMSDEELASHHRRTFGLSVNLMLLAFGAEIRAADVPELIDAFGWCSTMRDLREDLEAGLVNVPVEVIVAARSEGADPMDYETLIATRAITRWMGDELARAVNLLDATDEKLGALADRRGTAVLSMFSRSIRRFANRTFPQSFPMVGSASVPA